MRVLTRALATLGLAALAGATALSAQNPGVGSYRFYVGASGGAMNFATNAQSRGVIPMAGANALITAQRVALLMAMDVGLGSDEAATMADPIDGATRTVNFDHINRFYFELVAYPLKSHIQPFIGIGWGFQTLSNLRVQGAFLDDAAYQANQAQAEDLASTGFMQAVAGVEIRVGILSVFGSLSAATSPNKTDLIWSSVYTGQAGARISLGKAREDID